MSDLSHQIQLAGPSVDVIIWLIWHTSMNKLILLRLITNTKVRNKRNTAGQLVNCRLKALVRSCNYGIIHDHQTYVRHIWDIYSDKGEKIQHKNGRDCSSSTDCEVDWRLINDLLQNSDHYSLCHPYFDNSLSRGGWNTRIQETCDRSCCFYFLGYCLTVENVWSLAFSGVSWHCG